MHLSALWSSATKNSTDRPSRCLRSSKRNKQREPNLPNHKPLEYLKKERLKLPVKLVKPQVVQKTQQRI